MLIENGESAKYIQDQVGHGSITTTFDTYGHLMPQAKRAATKKLERYDWNSPRGDVFRYFAHGPPGPAALTPRPRLTVPLRRADLGACSPSAQTIRVPSTERRSRAVTSPRDRVA
jgi:hypothetical protein